MQKSIEYKITIPDEELICPTDEKKSPVFVAQTEPVSSMRHLKLIESINAFTPFKERPVWNEDLTNHLYQVNQARIVRQSIINASGVRAFMFYPSYIKHRMEVIIEQSANIGKSFYAHFGEETSLGIGIPSLKRIEDIEKTIQEGSKSRQILQAHTQNIVGIILKNAAIRPTPEVEEFISNASSNIVDVIKKGDEQIYLDKVKERLRALIQISNVNFSLIALKPKSIQHRLLKYFLHNFSAEEIIKYEPDLSTYQIRNAFDHLVAKGMFPKPTAEETKNNCRRAQLKNLENNPKLRTLKKRILQAAYQKFQASGGYSLDSRIKMSKCKGGSLEEIELLTKLGLSPRATAETIQKSINTVYCRMKATRENEKIRNEGKVEIGENTTFQQSFRELSLEKTIKKAFLQNQENAIESSLPHAQRVVIDLLQKLYPIDLLSQEQKEDLVERVARSVLESYKPDEKRGFQAQAVIWISQNLPESPIFGKIKREIASSAPTDTSSQ